MKRLLVLALLAGCAASRPDGAALDRAAVQAAYGISVDALRALPGVAVTFRPGVLVEKKHQLTVAAGSSDPRTSLVTLLSRLAGQSPSDPFALEGQPPVAAADLLAGCRALLLADRVASPPAPTRPCALQVRTAQVRYQVEITGSAEHYAATFHALGQG